MNRMLVIAGVVVLSYSSQASGQVVQLPTFQHFSVSTTVVVPDRGSGFVGGVDRASYGSSSSGVPGLTHLPGAGRLFGSRGIGSEISSSRAHASATIMDLDELDRAVLAEAGARRGAGAAAAGTAAKTDPAIQRKAAFLSKHIARTDHVRRPAAVAAQAPRR